MYFVPLISNVMAIIAVYELNYVFGRKKLITSILSIATLGLFMVYLAFSEPLKWQKRDNVDMKKHVGELLNSVIFAVVVAGMLRTFTFEAYTIPTPSMEKTLLVGDFLFVNKMYYGCRLPMTPFSVPLMHDKIPFLNAKSYTEIIKFPYIRLPKIQSVKRNDNVVFNWPMEAELPIDKRMNYIKRCVALPGDSLQIVDREIIINGERSILPERSQTQFEYFVVTNGSGFNRKQLREEFNIYYSKKREMDPNDYNQVIQLNQSGTEYLVFIPSESVEAFSKLPNVVKVFPINAETDFEEYDKDIPMTLRNYYERVASSSQELFPNHFHSEILEFNYTRDNFGPIYIPKKGVTVALDRKSLYFYERIIEVYEGNTLKVEGDEIYINGNLATEYTFKQDYYWMMGDNRHNSLDSRFWGYVPEDHIVGKPVFIWMSYDKTGSDLKEKIRFDRVFTTVHGEGPSKSYFFHFLIGLAIVLGVNEFFKKRNKAKKTDS